jgi:hypothetical protein
MSRLMDCMEVLSRPVTKPASPNHTGRSTAHCFLIDTPKTLDKKTVQHNVDDDILTKQFS